MLKKILPLGDLKNVMPTAAIQTGDGHVVHSCGDCEVDSPICPRSSARPFYVMDTQALDLATGTDVFVKHAKILSPSLQAPYFLHEDDCDGRYTIPLEQCEHTSSYMKVCKKEPSAMIVASKTEDH